MPLFEYFLPFGFVIFTGLLLFYNACLWHGKYDRKFNILGHFVASYSQNWNEKVFQGKNS